MLIETFKCTGCNKDIKLDVSKVQDSVNCPHCHQTLRMSRKSAVSNPKFRSVADLEKVYAESEQRRESSLKNVRRPAKVSGLSPQEALLVKMKNRSRKVIPDDPEEHFKQNIYPDELSIPFTYPSHWTFELAVAVNVVLSISVFLLYLGLIVGLAFSLVHHLYVESAALRLEDGTLDATKTVFFILVLFLGLATLFFLAKPLFVKTIQPIRREVDREKEPLLHALVKRVANYCGLEPPDIIMTCCSKNTRLIDDNGKRVLVIGLHEVANWNTRQFVYRLSFLFADFAQISEFQSLRLLNRLIYWWDEVADGYDFLDFRIKSQFSSTMKKKQSIFVSVFVKPYALIGWIGSTGCRFLFRFFRFLTRRLCAPIMRQIYSACEELACTAVGVEGVVSYFKSQSYTKRAKTIATKKFVELIDTAHPVKDFPLFVHSCHQFLGDVELEIEMEFANQTTKKTDMIECPRVIMEHAAKMNTLGIYRKEFPAGGAWINFASACRTATHDLRKDVQLWGWDVIADD